ncbi:MAG: glutamate formimidoyltransferase [Armatimonadetes bacterium]|nr:glutamate formimidoyltransferase [Armatimonadota bacterium]
MELVQCVPNFSEGRDATVIDAIVAAAASVPRVRVIDYSADPDHNRLVVTLVGPPEAVGAATFAAAMVAIARIDLTRHMGQHPRMGAVDVIPFTPLEQTEMATCVRIARRLGQRIGGELGVPVYFYEEAATRPERRSLVWVRGGGFEALRNLPLADERAPDAGPPRVHPTAGAVAIGARPPLIAFNVNLDTTSVEVARAIARRVRERDGGLVGVRALGFDLTSRGHVQVSLNITEPWRVPLYRVFEVVRLEAQRFGVAVTGSELVGALRLEDLLEVARYYLGLHGLQASQVLDLAIANAGSAMEDGEPASG